MSAGSLDVCWSTAQPLGESGLFSPHKPLPSPISVLGDDGGDGAGGAHGLPGHLLHVLLAHVERPRVDALNMQDFLAQHDALLFPQPDGVRRNDGG